MVENNTHLTSYLRVILKRRYTVFTFFIVIVVVTLLLSLNTIPVYTAAAKVLIQKNDENPLMANYRYGGSYDPEFLSTQSQIIKSEPVSQKVVKALDLKNTYASYFGHPQKDKPLPWYKGFYTLVTKVVGMGETDPNDQEVNANPNGNTQDEALQQVEGHIQMIRNGIVIEPVEESDIVAIRFTSANPKFSAQVVNAVSQAYIEVTLEMKMAASRQTIAWMTEKAEQERMKLEEKEIALQTYMRNENIITIEDRVAITPDRLNEISTQLTKAEVKRKELQALNTQISQLSKKRDDAETIHVIAANATLQSIRTQILTADQKITELSKKYGPKHPVIKRAVADLNKLEEKRKKEIQRIIQSIKNEYDLARSSETTLRNILENTKRENARFNEKNIQLGILKREIETNRFLYDALIKKIKEQSITDQAQSVDIWIIEKAKTPNNPSNQRHKQRMMLGLVIGLLGGIGLSFFLEYLDQTVKSPDEIENRFGLSVLGMVPQLKPKEKDPENAVIDAPATSFSETYKTIRTGILLSSAEKAPKTLLITSTSAGEGKTTTAINLAVTLAAQAATKVLIVDADLRKPRIDTVFDLDGSYGLSTFLAGMPNKNKDIIQQGPVPNLYCISAGPIPPNPSELLSAGLMKELINSLRDKFDFIVIDGPPVLPVADALLLSKVVDGVLMVIKSGKSTYEIVNRGVKALSDVDARIIGTILNGVDIKKNAYYNYGYHQYYQSYTSD